MLRSRKTWLVPSLLAVYVTFMFAYLLPRNQEVSNTEKIVVVAATYTVIVILYFLLRKKEKMAREREEDLKK